MNEKFINISLHKPTAEKLKKNALYAKLTDGVKGISEYVELLLKREESSRKT